MAKMKIEFLHHYRARHGLPWKDGLIAYLPRYAPAAFLWRRCSTSATGFRRSQGRPSVGSVSPRNALPKWGRPWRQTRDVARVEHVAGDGRDLVLFADTFDRYYERENLEAAERVLEAAGYRLPCSPAKAGPVRSAAVAPSCPPVSWIRPGRRPGARSTPSPRSSPRGPASWGSNPPVF